MSSVMRLGMAPAEFYIDDGYVGHLPLVGVPPLVLSWLWPMLPRPMERSQMLIRLALAQVEIRDRTLGGFNGFSYQLVTGDPEIRIARLHGIVLNTYDYLPLPVFLGMYPEFSSPGLLKMLADPSCKENEPYVDPQGYLGAPGQFAPRITTYGCKMCGIRFGFRGGWKAHHCQGIPAEIFSLNSVADSISKVPVNFKSYTRMMERARGMD